MLATDSVTDAFDRSINQFSAACKKSGGPVPSPAARGVLFDFFMAGAACALLRINTAEDKQQFLREEVGRVLGRIAEKGPQS